MPVVPFAILLPDTLWRAVQSLATQEGNATTVILRALEEYVTTTQKRRGRQRPDKYQKLVKAPSTPVSDLHLSARSATALRTLKIKYVYELAQMTPIDLLKLPNFEEKSLREVKEKLAALGLTLGTPLDDESYRAAVAVHRRTAET